MTHLLPYALTLNAPPPKSCAKPHSCFVSQMKHKCRTESRLTEILPIVFNCQFLNAKTCKGQYWSTHACLSPGRGGERHATPPLPPDWRGTNVLLQWSQDSVEFLIWYPDQILVQYGLKNILNCIRLNLKFYINTPIKSSPCAPAFLSYTNRWLWFALQHSR